MNFILLIARRGNGALSGTSTIQLFLDLLFGNFQTRRATVDNNTHPAPVGFSKGGDSEEMSE
jgi:hypothetical protein